MQSQFFWNTWEKNERMPYKIFLGIFVSCLLLLIYALLTGSSNIIDYEILLQSETVPVVVDTIEVFPFNMDVKVDAIIFNEWFGGTDLKISPFITYVYLFLTWSGFIALMAVSTNLKGFWYYFGTALLIVFVLSLRVEILELFGTTNQVGVIIALIIFLPLSYYFHSFAKYASPGRRILAFTVASLIFGGIILVGSNIEDPLLHFATYSLPSPIIITVIFIFMVAHEILAGLLSAVTSGNMGEGNWKHFLLISIIYLVNLSLILLTEIGILEVSIIPVNVVIFLMISAILGIWGFKQRESQYNYLVYFKPFGGILYLAVGIVALSTIAYFLVTGNDQISESMGDLVLYGHLGYGVMFLLYIMTNFLGPLLDNEKVGRIMYNPQSMPYFTYRFAGIVTTLAMVFLQEWRIPVYNAFSAYYNTIGDIYKHQGDNLSAIGYYKKGHLYSNNNNRSNYSLAKIYEGEKEYDKTLEHYSRSNRLRPSTFSYLNQANVYFNNDSFFETLFILERAGKDFPESGTVANNLGLMYGRTEVIDSALYFLEKAYKSRKSDEVAKGNILSTLVKSNIEIPNTDSLTSLFRTSNYSNKANYIALKTSRGSVVEEKLDIADSAMNRISHAYVYNYLLNKVFDPDTSAFVLGRKLIEESENRFYTRRLKLALALNYYYKEDITRGFDQLKGIILGDYTWAADIYNLLGLWYMEKGDYRSASDYFNKSIENFGREALLNHAIATSFTEDKEQAIQAWEKLQKAEKGYADIARRVKDILRIENPGEMMDGEDIEKYQWLIFNTEKFSEELLNTLENPVLKARLYIRKAKEELENDHPGEALNALNKIPDLRVRDAYVAEQFNFLKMDLLAVMGNIPELAQELDSAPLPEVSLRSKFYKALIYEDNGEGDKAGEIYDKWALKDPFYEEFVISAASWYDQRNEFEPGYLFLLEAIKQNRHSVRLNKAYILYCGKWGSRAFGESQLVEFRNLVPEDEYRAVEERFYRLLYEWSVTDPEAASEEIQ